MHARGGSVAQLVADFVLERLRAWGVRRVFGYPGDGINAFLGALDRQGKKDPIEFVQARHEELAAFLASAHAKFTGEVGVCLATSGPGAIHLLNGLYDAKMDHQPVVAIVGQQKTTALGADYQQEVDLVSLFKDVAHQYVHMCAAPAAARHLVDRAVRIALAERTVTCVIFPNDVQEEKAVPSPPRKHGSTYSGVGWTPPRVVPQKRQLQQAAQVLNAGEKVAILVGAGALEASAEVEQVADLLGAGVAKALLGKAVLPDELPYVTGSIGLLGTQCTDEMMQSCDTLLMIGTSFPYSEWLPKEGTARGVQIDLSARMLDLRYPCEVALCGDAKATLRELIPMLDRKEDRSWREWIEERVAAWWDVLEARAHVDADPINPQRVFWELSPRLPDRCILTSDSGSSANWWARDLKIRRGMMASLSGNLATMGCGVPYALAAKLAHPDRPVIACVGDGAMQMNGISGLLTIASRWKDWADPRLIVLVLNNGDLNQVTWEQRAMAGDPRNPVTQSLPEFGYADYARLIGIEGIRVDRPQDVAGAWDQALAADRPVLLEAMVDPEVPPLPPHIRLDQARKLMTSLAKGEPREGHTIRQMVKDFLAR
jgi:pyruvate dehydrogenase (quinone)